MDDNILWEPIRVSAKGDLPDGPRRALFYKVTHRGMIYRVMLGIDETGRWALLEHHVEDASAPRFYPYRLLPYMQQRYSRGDGPGRFSTMEQAMAHVEQRIREWEATQRP